MKSFGKIIKPLNWSLAALLVVLMSACGGDGGGSSDTTAPTVSATTPLDGATNVSLNSSVSATFSEAMNAATITSSTFTLKQGTTLIPGAVSYVGTTATFNPTSNLTASTLYTATVTTGAKDLAGRALAQDMVWSFTTGTTVDTTAPAVTLTYPVDAGTNVAINTSLSATFSETMDAATITTTTFTLTQGATAVPGTVTYIGKIATFNPASNLSASTLYTATVTTGAKDLAGNALTQKVWTFTTGTTTDTTAPTVSSTVPLANALNVSINSNVTATFSEVMDATTLSTAIFGLKQGSTVIPGAVTYVGNTATFNPSANLTVGLVYTATVTTGVQDMAGNAMVSADIWSFTAGTAIPNPTAPDLGEAGRFVIMANQLISTTGTTAISNGDIGITPAARTFITGFTPMGSAGDFAELTNGTSYAPEDANPSPFPYPLHYATLPVGAQWTTTGAMLTQAATDLGNAATFLAADPNPSAPTQVSPTELGTLVLTRGVYMTASNVGISTGPLTLDAQGDPDSVFIFNIGGTLTTGASGSIILAGQAQAKNIYWRTGGDTVIAAGTAFYGNVIAWTQINVLAGANVTGSLFAVTDQVTLISDTVTKAP